MKMFYLSVCTDDVFLGCAFVVGEDFEVAASGMMRRFIDPGAEIIGFAFDTTQLSDSERVIVEANTDRVMSIEDMEELGLGMVQVNFDTPDEPLGEPMGSA